MAGLKDFAGVARAPFLLLPPTLVASGAAAAAWDGSFSWLHTAMALVGLVALHMAVNILNEWSDLRTEKISEALERYRSEPRNEELAAEALQTLAGYQDRDGFRALMPEVVGALGANVKILNLMGEIAQDFGLLKESERLFRHTILHGAEIIRMSALT